MPGVRARNESAWLLPNDGSRTNHGLRRDMRRFEDSDTIDMVVVGCGAGGSVLAQRLARAGWRVAALEAGPFWDPDTDWVSDEAGSHHLYWTEPRVIAGSDPVPMGSNNSGRGVGGSMVHYAGYTPRFHPSDFATYAADGVGADWPLDYADLRPYYTAIEQELPVAGESWPWGDPHGYPYRPHPIEANVAKWWRSTDAEADIEADPINPMLVFRELSSRLPMDAIVTADSGSSANWYARQLKFRGDMRGSLSGNLATMGPGVPYGIGAKFGHPDRPVIVFAGDGAMQMNGLAELITIKHYWEQWRDSRLIVAVLHNNDLNQVTWEMRAMEGAPKFTESQRLPDVSYESFARGLGLHGMAVDKPEQVGPAWDQALAADRPTVLDFRTDPDVPPIPPHATFEQMKDATRALLKGDPDSWGIIKEGLLTKAREVMPGKNS